MLFFVAINGLGFAINLALYINDIKKMDGVLNKVAKDDTLEVLMTSPEIPKAEIMR